MTELATAILSLIGQLVPLAVQAFNAQQADAAQIKADANAAVSSFLTTIGALPDVLASDDAEADADAGRGRSQVSVAITIGTIPVFELDGALVWQAGLAVDADGAPNAYAPAGSALAALDNLANAGRPGDWWGVATDTGRPDGTPVVQGPSDPDPGFDVSETSLGDRSRQVRDPRRYVDSIRVPYIAVPPELLGIGARMGDVAMVVRRATGASSAAVVADVGPHRKIGEGSIALAAALSLDASPRHGGASSGIACVLFCGSRRGWPRTVEDFSGQAGTLFSGWGGVNRLGTVLA
jgi:hypothetical protein